jgi:flavin reductase (DIM6/NTAB) family NADH-FMN oxidoreductase RutF
MTSLIIPRPIAFVSTVDAAGRMNLAPFSYYMGVASEPPLLALSISTRAGRPKDTARNILGTGEFVVNMATEELAQAMNLSSGDWDADVDEFALTRLTPVPATRVRPPRVAESPVALECRRERILPLGTTPHDTWLVLGEIVWLHVRDDVLEAPAPGPAADEPRYADPARLRPIARLGRNLYTKLGEMFAMDRPKGSRP